MINKSRLFTAIFSTATLFIVLISFAINLLDISSSATLLGASILMGLLLSAILFYIFSSLIKPDSEADAAVTEEPPEEALFDKRVVQLLGILQRKGRLIDFLQEDIAHFDDKQIGSAVRNIHKECGEALSEYVGLEAVMKEQEGVKVTIEQGFDPSAIRLTGNVIGEPPFKGTLRHCGWRIPSTEMPDLVINQDLSIVEPAEVEIS